MSGPTREGPLPPEDGERARLAALLGTIAYWQLPVRPGAERERVRVDLLSAAALLRRPPPPPAAGVSKETPEDGERAKYAAFLERCAAWVERGRFVQEANFAEQCRAAAGLLRRPRGGVSKEAVKAAIGTAFWVSRFGATEAYRLCLGCGSVRFAEEWHAIGCPAGALMAAIEALPEAAPRSRKPQRGELYVEALVDASGDAAGFAVFAVDENLDDEDHPALLTVEDIDNDARDLLEAMCEALNRAAAAPPSGVDREAEGWHYLPELPPDGPVREFWCWSNGFPGTLSPEIRGYASAAIDAARWAAAGIYSWKPTGEPPPLPEAKP